MLPVAYNPAGGEIRRNGVGHLGNTFRRGYWRLPRAMSDLLQKVREVLDNASAQVVQNSDRFNRFALLRVDRCARRDARGQDLLRPPQQATLQIRLQASSDHPT